MCINIQLKHQRGNTKANILIDLGAERLLINKQFCRNKGIKLEKIPIPIPVFNIDNLASHKGALTNKAYLLMRITNLEGDYHNEQCRLLATNLGGENIILETDQLYEHNSQINWVKNCLTFALCLLSCIISRPKVTINIEKLIWHGPRKIVNYVTIENELENLLEHNDKDLEGINEFLTILYENRYNEALSKQTPIEQFIFD